jgi:hypothetical protein
VTVRLTAICFAVCFAAGSIMAGGSNRLFQLSDHRSRDYKVANLTIDYSDGVTADGFRILYGNQPKFILWSTVAALEIQAPPSNGAAATYVDCSARLLDGTRQKLTCLNGTIHGQTRNGEYSNVLSDVIQLVPWR